jgi:hypothetical protein
MASTAGMEGGRSGLSTWGWPAAPLRRGDNAGGAVRWLLATVDGSSSGVVHGRSSGRAGLGQRMAGAARPRGGTHGHGGSFRNSQRCRCIDDAWEPARA